MLGRFRVRVIVYNLSVTRPYVTSECIMIGVAWIIARGIPVFWMFIVYDPPLAFAMLQECALAFGAVGRK